MDREFAELVEGPFPFLDTVCDNEHLLEVAQCLSQWKTFAPWLGFETTAVEDLEIRPLDQEGKRQHMFMIWKRAKGSEATYLALAEACLKSNRQDMAEKVLKYSKKGESM